MQMQKWQHIDILCMLLLLNMLLHEYNIRHQMTSPTDCDGCRESHAITINNKSAKGASK